MDNETLIDMLTPWERELKALQILMRDEAQRYRQRAIERQAQGLDDEITARWFAYGQKLASCRWSLFTE